MIAVVQRVTEARVLVAGECVGAIERGLLVLVGVEHADTDLDADVLARKVAALRVFPGRTPTDLALAAVGGGCLVVSQFTLAAELASGNRPDFTGAAPPALAAPLCERVASQLAATGLRVATGRFGASMRVELANDGPFTLVLAVQNGRVVERASAP